MAPAGAVGLAGAVGGDIPVVGMGVCLGVGKDGSVGPVPGVATGLPSMMLLQPATSATPTSMAASGGDQPAKPRAFCDNRTRYSQI
jgi:hypothetical protein